VNKADWQYQMLCKEILAYGEKRKDRTGTGTLSIFSHQMSFNMEEGFPLLTTKDMNNSFEHIKAEMLWMLKGSTNANELADMGFGIWRKWADENGELGPVYGFQMRNFDGDYDSYQDLHQSYGTDQISWIINELKTNPHSRRMVVSLWNPNQLDEMALPPCHWAFELYVDFRNNSLNMKLHQRSCDVFLGVPYNIAEYSLLLHMISHVTGYQPGTLVYDMSNVHIYNDHIPQIEEQLTRKGFHLPTLIRHANRDSIFDFEMQDYSIKDYFHHDKLTGKVSV
jgi:thymidylate synthase